MYRLSKDLIDRKGLTVNPSGDNTFGEGQDHQGERRAVPVHDLEVVDATLGT